MSSTPPPPPADSPSAYEPPPEKNSGIAVTSLILGIFGLCLFPLGVIALILGIVGINKTSQPGVGGRGMAVAGTVLGGLALVMVVPLALMAGILLPALGRAHEIANRSVCAANMSGLYKAMYTYSVTNDDQFPPNLGVLVVDGSISQKVLHCPSEGEMQPMPMESMDKIGARWFADRCDYIYVHPPEGADVPADDIVIYEPFTHHDGEGTNICFGDGHVRFINAPEARRLLADQGLAPPPPE